MTVTLEKLKFDDAVAFWEMQTAAFECYSVQYGSEFFGKDQFPLSHIRVELQYRNHGFYFIKVEDARVGGLRIIEPALQGSRRKIAPLFVCPPWQNQRIATAALETVYQLYGSDAWELDTILEERKNLHLYQKSGFHIASMHVHESGRCTIATMYKGASLKQTPQECLRAFVY